MSAPRVSAVIPVFNGEAFVADAVESVRAQTTRPGEIIVVDDASTDDSADRAAALGDDVSVVRRDENGGLPEARNSGIEASTGELIAFLRTDGCRLPSGPIAVNKAYTAARERTESRTVGQASRDEGFPMTNFGELRYVSWGGGVPVVVDGEVVGAVGVSGLPEADDVELARNAAALLE